MALPLILALAGLGAIAYGYGSSKGGNGDAATSAGPPQPDAPPSFTPDMLPSGTPYLAQGSRGAAVQRWQQFLLFKGYALNGGADGSFGPSTAQNTRAFQSKAGLAADGIVGPATIAAARASL